MRTSVCQRNSARAKSIAAGRATTFLNAFTERARASRPRTAASFKSLLTFCRLNKGRVHFVVVFNLTRFARDKYDHFALRSLLQSLGISLRSATDRLTTRPPES